MSITKLTSINTSERTFILMKILFWLLSIISVFAGLFVSILCYMSYGLGLYGTGFGQVVCMVGMAAVVICIVCGVLGIIKLRKGHGKKALAFALAGLVYCGMVIGAIYIDDAIHTKQLEKSIAERNEQLYGEGWDSTPLSEYK